MVRQHLLSGCSFTDPTWQKDVPWSVEYAKAHPSYIVAKSGMGIKGICTETMYHLKTFTDISTLIIILPTMWRLDLEVDQETYLCNAMVDLVVADSTGWTIQQKAQRKWLISGGLHYQKNTEQGKIFKQLYKHQGYLVLAKEHFSALTSLLNYCKMHNIEYFISAIQDPMDQLVGLDYMRKDFCQLLDEVEYNKWFKFDNKFIDQYLGHSRHPTTQEHIELCKHIINF